MSSYINAQERKISERRFGLRPPKKEIPERGSGVPSENTPGCT